MECEQSVILIVIFSNGSANIIDSFRKSFSHGMFFVLHNIIYSEGSTRNAINLTIT